MKESRDPRPKRSRDRITMELFRLLKTNSFSSITVKMLTDGAGVNRSTFMRTTQINMICLTKSLRNR